MYKKEGSQKGLSRIILRMRYFVRIPKMVLKVKSWFKKARTPLMTGPIKGCLSL